MSNYNQIDLDKVKGKIAELSFIEESKAYILNEEVPFNPIQVRRNILETDEFLNLLNSNFTINFDGIENINRILDKADKDILLTANECARVLNFHNHIDRIKKLLAKIDDELNIKDYYDSLIVNNVLGDKINRVVDNNGNIKDDASDKLKQIIHDIDTNEKFLYNTAHNFINRYGASLQEPAIYMRNDRVVFLMKNSDKNKFNGYTYGTSASGAASYVEPECLMNYNNKKISLEEDKIEEINRILMELTFAISKESNNFRRNFDSIVKLNVVYAKAQYGFNNHAIMAKISDNLYLKDICHPLIDYKKVVSNTYELTKAHKGIVISGTNTGGKTVGLKTIGLAVLMTYLGIPLISEESYVPMYDCVYVDIDDNQSISNSLSTFSAHLSNINDLLNKANNRSLILIDELISGTDPKEAQAISLAILDKILKLGSSFVITTHYDDIKNYSYKNPNIILSSVGFDYNTLKPTYKYIENSVGASNAIDIAERYIDDKELIAYAREIIKNSSSKEEELLNRLAKEIEENETLKNTLNKQIEESEAIKAIFNKKIEEFDLQKEELRKAYQDKLNLEIEEIRQKALEKLESIKEIKQKNVVKEIEDLYVEPSEDFLNEINVNYEVGDRVRVGESERIGTITQIKGEKVQVNINGLLVNTSKDNLTKMPKLVQKERKGESERHFHRGVTRELNIVGQHIDEGIVMLESYLDSALLNGYSQVKIIHGIGTGQLKNAVWAKLKQLKFVKSFSYGDYNDGGSAVTIVVLKK